jgi:hypothetical protein
MQGDGFEDDNMSLPGAAKTSHSFHDPIAAASGHIGAMGSTETLSPSLEPPVDWAKVGKPYKATDKLESVIEKEMARLKIAMDKRIVAQDIELEEKVMISRGKKK